jgi:hypothetical protein
MSTTFGGAVEPERMAAARAGKTFYEGKECPRGHGTTRYVISGKCRECMKERARINYYKIADQIKAARGGNDETAP